MDDEEPVHQGSIMSDRWPALMTYKMAAEYLSVDYRTVQRLVAAGELETRAFSRSGVRIPQRSLDQWIESLPTSRVLRNRERRLG